MKSIVLNLSNVTVPGIPLPVSGEVDFLPECGVFQEDEILDGRLAQADGSPVGVLSPASYQALLAAAVEAHREEIRSAYERMPVSSSDLPFFL